MVDYKSIAHSYFNDSITTLSTGIKLSERTFIILVGVQGSGKSTLSKYLSEKLPFMVISTDKIKTYINTSYELKDLFKVQKLIINLCLEYNISVIADSNTDTTKYRRRLRNIANKYKYKTLVINVLANEQDCLNRVLKRNSIKDPSDITNWKKTIVKNINKTQVPRNAIQLINDGTESEFYSNVDAYILPLIS